MDILSLIFPRRCLGCGAFGAYLCAECVNFFVPMNELFCPVCRRPSHLGKTHPQCRKRSDLDGLISGYPYAGLMVKVVTRFKYSFVSDLTTTLIELMISGINHPFLFTEAWVLMSVPLHKTRHAWRGFNQADLLAKGLSTSWNFPFVEALKRAKKTEPQMTLSGKERRTNLKNAFEATLKTVPPHILLVDDVATTCSTLQECARVLKSCGAKEVWGLTLAQKIPA